MVDETLGERLAGGEQVQETTLALNWTNLKSNSWMPLILCANKKIRGPRMPNSWVLAKWCEGILLIKMVIFLFDAEMHYLLAVAKYV